MEKLSPQLLNKIFNLKIIKDFSNLFAKELDNFFIVGGAIRDLLLSNPIKDIDLATKFTPDELIKICQEKNIKYQSLARKFGTVLIILEDNNILEITSFRKDIKTDGRHSEVKFCRDMNEDSKRRDFTINSFYLSFKSELFDPNNARLDLKNKILSFIGSPKIRIKEDFLRILRLFRFTANLDGFVIENNSFLAVIELKENIYNLSSTRIKQEMEKLFFGINAKNILHMLSKYKILEKYFDFSKINNLAYKNIEKTPKNIVFHCFLSKIGRKKIEFSRKEQEDFDFLDKHQAFDENSNNDLDIKKNLYIFGREKYLLSWYNFIFTQNKNYFEYQNILEKVNQLKTPKFPISGKDLQAKNVKQGKEMGIILKKLESKWLESDFSLNKKNLLSELVNL